MKKQSKKKQQPWCVIHWLGGEVKMYGSEKNCKAWAKRNSFNPEAPIFYAFPVAGILIHNHKYEHVHINKGEKIKAQPI